MEVEVINGSKPIAPQVIADAIVEMSKAMRSLNESRLKREAIVTLIAHNSKIGKKTIEMILNNLEQLEQRWLKPETQLAHRLMK